MHMQHWCQKKHVTCFFGDKLCTAECARMQELKGILIAPIQAAEQLQLETSQQMEASWQTSQELKASQQEMKASPARAYGSLLVG